MQRAHTHTHTHTYTHTLPAPATINLWSRYLCCRDQWIRNDAINLLLSFNVFHVYTQVCMCVYRHVHTSVHVCVCTQSPERSCVRACATRPRACSCRIQSVFLVCSFLQLLCTTCCVCGGLLQVLHSKKYVMRYMCALHVCVCALHVCDSVGFNSHTRLIHTHARLTTVPARQDW
jgi:hypothetical protein